MKFYFAKKPDHANINRYHLPYKILKDTIKQLSKDYSHFLIFSDSTDGHIIAHFDSFLFDDNKKMFYIDAIFVDKAFEMIYENIKEEYLIDVYALSNISESCVIETLLMRNYFYFVKKSDTNIE